MQVCPTHIPPHERREAQGSNPLSASEPCNLVADGYAETTMRVFEKFADEAIAASKLKPKSTVLDPDTTTSPCIIVMLTPYHCVSLWKSAPA